MPEEGHLSDKPASGEDSSSVQGQTPYESIISLAVNKIKDQPFLFVIAITALLIGLTILAAGIGSADLRFLVIVIAVLAFLVIAGYYLQAAWQAKLKLQREAWQHQEKVAAAKRRADASAGVKSGKAARKDQQTSTEASTAAVSSGSAIGSKPAPTKPHSDAEELLALHQSNLSRLLKKKAVYAAGEEPLSLLNQIESEEKEIQRIRSELSKLD